MARTLRANTNLDENGNEIEQEPTRRGKPSKHPLPMGGNVTDETVAEFGNKALAAKLEAEKKRDEAKTLDSQFRSVLKSAKAAGVDPDAVRWWLKARKMEPEDLDREILWQNRLARVMRLPIGTQLGVDFETGETIATQVDEKETRKAAKKASGKPSKKNGNPDNHVAYIAGYDAAQAGKSAKTAGKGMTGEAAVAFQKGAAGNERRGEGTRPRRDDAVSGLASRGENARSFLGATLQRVASERRHGNQPASGAPHDAGRTRGDIAPTGIRINPGGRTRRPHMR